MKGPLRHKALAIVATTTLVSPLALSHLNDKEPQQSYRQSYFAMVAMNFGPIAETMKGNIPWNDDMMATWAGELATLATLDVTRSFGPGSDKGTTRAKPAIWENMDDFKQKMADFQTAAAALNEAVAGGDKQAIGAAVGEVGGACKACHDEYKSKDYLY